MTDESTNRMAQQQETSGGRSSRGPEYGTPGEPQVPVPPYDELRGEPSAAGAEGVHRAFDASNAPAPDSDVPTSAQEHAGMSSTETEPGAPLGVGESRSRGGEQIAPDRPDVDAKGPAQRPVGRTPQDDVGDEVNPNPARTPGAPGAQTGDQGG